MILYTSGTTSRPKGVVTDARQHHCADTSLRKPGSGSANDRILLCLPLHHVHGIINVVSCALWSGAVCEMLPRFDADVVWKRIATGEPTLFMAVPTIHFKLITAWDIVLRPIAGRFCAEVLPQAAAHGLRLGRFAGEHVRSAGARSPATPCWNATA